MTAPATFKQSDITRVIKGLKNAGELPVGLKVNRDGSIYVALSSDNNDDEVNEWDFLLEGE